MRYGLLAIGLIVTATIGIAWGEESTAPGLELVEARKIWDAAPHNAFTDLIRFQDRWYCAFREGAGHGSFDGKLRVIASEDGDTWKSAALLTYDDGDIRDAKLSIAADGRLMLSGAVRYDKPRDGYTFKSLVWFSKDGANWTDAQEIGEPDMWIWSVTWHDDTAYGVGYGCGDEQIARLYSSQDGVAWKTQVANLFPRGGSPNEASLLFAKDKTCYCLLRRETDDQAGQLGVSQPPYTQWTWKSVGQPIGGPKMVELPDGRLLAAVRLYGGDPHTSVCWIDRESGHLTESLRLPSGGDTSYPGIVLAGDGLVWISYYSGHEDKTSIYLAKVKVTDQ